MRQQWGTDNMKEFYTFPTIAKAQACIDDINSNPVFPITGTVNGKPAPDHHQKTLRWCDYAKELSVGGYAVPRIPTQDLDKLQLPEQARAQFIKKHGQNIRQLNGSDFKQTEEDI